MRCGSLTERGRLCNHLICLSDVLGYGPKPAQGFRPETQHVSFSLIFNGYFRFAPTSLHIYTEVDMNSLDGSITWRSQHEDHHDTQAIEARNSLVQCIFSTLPPNPALLEPTKRHVRIKTVRTIDPCSPRLEPVCCIERTLQVLREHSSQPIYNVVRLSDHVVLIFELDDDTDRTEDFFLHDLHRRVDIGKDGGCDEVAFCSLALTANLESRPWHLLLFRIGCRT